MCRLGYQYYLLLYASLIHCYTVKIVVCWVYKSDTECAVRVPNPVQLGVRMLIFLRVFSVQRSMMSCALGRGGMTGVFFCSSSPDGLSVGMLSTSIPTILIIILPY